MNKKIIFKVVIFFILIGGGYFGYVLAQEHGIFRNEDTTYDINELVDLDYEAELHEAEGDLYVTIVSDHLSEEEALQIVLHVANQENESIAGFVFHTQEEAESMNELTDFYHDGLQIAVYEAEDEAYQTRTFYSYPEVEADAEAIAAWEIDSEDSGTTEENVLEIYGMVDQVATEEETLAQIMGFATMTQHFNPEASFESQHYQIQRGTDIFEYNTNHEQILALQMTFNVQIETTESAE